VIAEGCGQDSSRQLVRHVVTGLFVCELLSEDTLGLFEDHHGLISDN
jgi:hypothetical protein